MEPLVFGSSERPLFGMYHPGSERGFFTRGVVLAYPLGNEYFSAYSSFRQLALQLSQAGRPILRFDYYGTGDSAGETGEGDVRQWCDDLRSAIEELRATARVEVVDLVGLRLGASIAALVASEEPVERIVLWEPVVHGRTYLDELQEAQARFLEISSSRPRGAAAGGASFEAVGFPVSPELERSIEDLTLLTLDQAPSQALVLAREDDRSATLLEAHLRSLGCATARREVCGPRLWDWERGINDSLIPRDALAEIGAFLC
jgi:pimeloyl-ACP methyl ester carboxylesterase